uniref:Uncharacterized protein n=1 Tax=Panagrolaimus sp. PS1159 TaxID=55785 RepID=A0AC35GAV3_9BILA
MTKYSNIACLFVIILVVGIMIESNYAQYIDACNEVCRRSNPEKDSCCRAHGSKGSQGCESGRMLCYINDRRGRSLIDALSGA